MSIPVELRDQVRQRLHKHEPAVQRMALAVSESVTACRMDQSASADSPFATSLSWWKKATPTQLEAGFSRLAKT